MIYLFFSVILFACNNVLWKKHLQEAPLLLLVSYRALLTTLIASALLFSEYRLFDLFGFPWVRITLGSLFGAIGLFCMLTVIKNASLQWLGIYNLLGILFTSSYLYFFETNYEIQSIAGILLIVFGYVFYLYQNKNSSQKLTLKQHIYMLVMTLSFGIASLIHWKNLEGDVPAIFILSNQEATVFLISSVLVWMKKPSIPVVENLKQYFPKVFLMASIIFLALLFSFMGLKITNPVISSIIFLSTPLLTIVFSSLYFKEKLTFYHVLSILCIASGAFLLHYQTV
jgi:drug/metabolite transporter (DMT)-like permease